MRAVTSIVVVLATVLFSSHAAWAQTRPEERRALREQLERKYDLVALTDGVGLRPKVRGDVRLVEVTAGTILVNGAVGDRSRAARPAGRRRRRGAALVVPLHRRTARSGGAAGASRARCCATGTRTAARARPIGAP